MQTMHPVIVFGSYMLDAENVPPDEFEVRLMAVQALMASRGWAGLIAYGDPEESAFLTYATNYAPRNRQTLALVPAAGRPRMLIWASPRDIRREAAITWLDDVRMVGKLDESLAAWLGDAGIERGAVALVGGAVMRPPIHDAIAGACAARGLSTVDADAPLATLLHRKRPREMVMVRRAAAVLDEAVSALGAAWRVGAPATDCVLAAETAAYGAQALDARTLFSLDGGRTLRPFERPLPDRADRLSAYVAVRYQAYWAAGFVTLSRRRTRIQAAAAEALDRMIAASRPGATAADLAAAAGDLGGFTPHAVLGGALGHGIGLSLSEPPALRPGGTGAMVEDGTYALTVGLSAGRRSHAFTSAMLALGPVGAEILWRAR